MNIATVNRRRRGARQAAAALVALIALPLAAGCKGGSSSSGGGGAEEPPPPVVLPEEFETLEEGFRVDLVAGGLSMPVKLAQAPDGRVFFNELQTGNVRIIDAEGNLVAQPFATVAVLTGGEQGLIGLALSPGFKSNGYVYAMACVDGPPRQQVLRFRDENGVGQDPTVIVDNLPEGFIHNSGDIQFLEDGTLLVSVGDIADPDLSQTDGALAGRILRYTEDGGIPGNNPIPGSPEWCRGLRNTFDLYVHPKTGGVFGVENGPATDDELNYLAKSKNFAWPDLPPEVPGADVGLRLQVWGEVIAPTGLTFHSGRMFGDEFKNDLFVLSYVDVCIYWLKMSGNGHVDIDEIVVFAQLEDVGTQNKPLDAIEAEDGSLWFSTFTGIWRVYR